MYRELKKPGLVHPPPVGLPPRQSAKRQRGTAAPASDELPPHTRLLEHLGLATAMSEGAHAPVPCTGEAEEVDVVNDS